MRAHSVEIKSTDGKVLISIEGDTPQGADLQDANLYIGNIKVKTV